MYKLLIFKYVNGEWVNVATIYGETDDDCLDQAEREYGSNNEYHWSYPTSA